MKQNKKLFRPLPVAPIHKLGFCSGSLGGKQPLALSVAGKSIPANAASPTQSASAVPFPYGQPRVVIKQKILRITVS